MVSFVAESYKPERWNCSWSTAPVQPILAKMGKKLYCDANNGKKENVESPSDFSKLARLLGLLNRVQAAPSATPFFFKKIMAFLNKGCLN